MYTTYIYIYTNKRRKQQIKIKKVNERSFERVKSLKEKRRRGYIYLESL